MKFSDIPQFPFASYRVNMPWDHIQRWMDGNKDYYVLDLDPPYQRGYVWTPEQQTAYLEYQLRGGFSGKDIFWNAPEWNKIKGKGSKLEIVDGKQRLKAVSDFLGNKVKAFGHFYKEFEDQLGITGHDFIFHVNNLQTEKSVVKWYIGMNTGGSVHTEKDLKPALDLLKKLDDE